MSSWQQTIDDITQTLTVPRCDVEISPQRLRRMYEDEKLSTAQIGEKIGCSGNTVRRLMEDAGIERRERTDIWENKKYRDESWLEKQIREQQRSFTDIADECDVTRSTIGDWADKHDIEKPKKIGCNFSLGGRGNVHYPLWSGTGSGVKNHILVHRLVLVAEGEDPHEIWDGEYKKQVHHRNGFKCDNRPSNLELVDRRTHGRHHTPNPAKWTDDDLHFVVKFMLNPQNYIENNSESKSE